MLWLKGVGAEAAWGQEAKELCRGGEQARQMARLACAAGVVGCPNALPLLAQIDQDRV